MRILIAALVLALLSACAKQQPEPALAVAPYCEVARPVYWSAKDTRATKEQADRENAKWKRLCGDVARARAGE
jgi:type IV pilus biogenesis protein CpaD/CtpE